MIEWFYVAIATAFGVCAALEAHAWFERVRYRARSEKFNRVPAAGLNLPRS